MTDGAQISRPLADAGIDVSELRAEGANLEQVFLALTTDHGDTAARQPLPVPETARR